MLRGKRLLVLLCIAMLCVFAFTVQAQYVTQNVNDNGLVDWSQQKVRATGIASPDSKLPIAAQRAGALEAAKLVALRNLLQTVQGMAITSETTVRNMMLENDEIRTQVQGYVRGFTVVDTRYMSDASVEVDVEIPVSGISSALLPPGKDVPMGSGEVMEVGYPAAPAAPKPNVVTGLIIDATNLGVMPAMAPKVLDEEGNEVYGSRLVNREWAVKQGMVGYDKDVRSARNNKRVAPSPMVIRALKAVGNNKADIVISNKDAQALKDAIEHQNFLDKCQVMFVVD